MPIINGVDSFEVRLWATSMVIPYQLIVLSYKNGQWQPRYFLYKEMDDGVVNSKEETIHTNYPAALLADSLQWLHLNSFISQQGIKNYTDNIVDGTTYHLEIATKHSYKILTYHAPERFADTEINNRKFLNLLYLLNNFIPFSSFR